MVSKLPLVILSSILECIYTCDISRLSIISKPISKQVQSASAMATIVNSKREIKEAHDGQFMMISKQASLQIINLKTLNSITSGLLQLIPKPHLVKKISIKDFVYEDVEDFGDVGDVVNALKRFQALTCLDLGCNVSLNFGYDLMPYLNRITWPNLSVLDFPIIMNEITPGNRIRMLKTQIFNKAATLNLGLPAIEYFDFETTPGMDKIESLTVEIKFINKKLNSWTRPLASLTYLSIDLCGCEIGEEWSMKNLKTLKIENSRNSNLILNCPMLECLTLAPLTGILERVVGSCMNIKQLILDNSLSTSPMILAPFPRLYKLEELSVLFEHNQKPSYFEVLETCGQSLKKVTLTDLPPLYRLALIKACPNLETLVEREMSSYSGNMVNLASELVNVIWPSSLASSIVSSSSLRSLSIPYTRNENLKHISCPNLIELTITVTEQRKPLGFISTIVFDFIGGVSKVLTHLAIPWICLETDLSIRKTLPQTLKVLSLIHTWSEENTESYAYNLFDAIQGCVYLESMRVGECCRTDWINDFYRLVLAGKQQDLIKNTPREQTILSRLKEFKIRCWNSFGCVPNTNLFPLLVKVINENSIVGGVFPKVCRHFFHLAKHIPDVDMLCDR